MTRGICQICGDMLKKTVSEKPYCGECRKFMKMDLEFEEVEKEAIRLGSLKGVCDEKQWNHQRFS